MCLEALRKVKQDHQKGFAYKVVRPILGEQDCFSGKWPVFRQKGGGTTDKSKYTVRNCVTWKIGRMYRVKHNRVVMVFGTPYTYPAWVHLYKTLGRAIANTHFGEVVIVCWYTSGKYEDGDTIVAKRVTPLLVLPTSQDVASFDMMRKHYGIKEAVRRYRECQEVQAEVKKG